MITSILLATLVSATPTSQIAVVKQLIPRGGRVDLTKVSLIRRKSRQLPRFARPLIWQAGEQLRARRALRVGSIIGQWDVEPMPDIVAGDPVTVELSKGRVRVSATAVAKQDGFAGETIWVQNSKSHRRIRVRVIESGRVTLVGAWGKKR